MKKIDLRVAFFSCIVGIFSCILWHYGLGNRLTTVADARSLILLVSMINYVPSISILAMLHGDNYEWMSWKGFLSFLISMLVVPIVPMLYLDLVVGNKLWLPL